MATDASPGFANDWQAGKTLVECNLRMLQENYSCDVTFRCGTEGHVVKAHRYVLISRSCVFDAMLTGTMMEKSDIKIPDIEQHVFKTFLKYIYTDLTDIDADNVTALLYAAKKYGVTSLETKCTEFLDLNLNAENAFSILEAAHLFDQKQLYEKALTLIKSQGERSLKSPGFLALSQVFVDEIVGSDDLEADEHVIFTAVNDWAEAECGREGREVTPESKRSVLGDILMKVRFPLMKPIFLVKIVKKSKLLTDPERILCLDYALVPGECLTPFNQTQRTKMISSQTVSQRRFWGKPTSWGYIGKIDAICFSSSSNLSLEGCQLYGALRGEPTYKVTTYLGDEDNVMSSVVQERKEYPCEREVFDVMFPSPVFVSAGEWYTLAVLIEGPNTWGGQTGLKQILCKDRVELQFRDSAHSIGGTDIKQGQIPSLIYRKL